MQLVFGLDKEINVTLVGEGRKINIARASDGKIVVVGPSLQTRDHAWYLRVLAGAIEKLRGRPVRGLIISGDEPLSNRRWYITTLQAAMDAVRGRRFRPSESNVVHLGMR